jgi:hypothetical protein
MENKLTDTEKLSFFGEIVAKACRDRGIFCIKRLFAKKNNAPIVRELIEKLSEFTQSQQATIEIAVARSLDGAIHDLLFALYCEERIVIMVDGTDIREISDGWHGDNVDWINEFSEYAQLRIG